MIDEIRIVPAPGGVAVQQIEAGVVVKATLHATKVQAVKTAERAGQKAGVTVEDWTEVE